MTRTKSPAGKRVLLALKVSEAQQAAYDTARGDVPLADWVRSALDRAAGLPAGVTRAVTPEGQSLIDDVYRNRPDGTGRTPSERRSRSAGRTGKAPVPQAAFSDPPVNPLAPPAKRNGKFDCCTHCPPSCGGNHTAACRKCG
jgi:hypothetical protein